MTMIMKRFVVDALEWLCARLDDLPRIERENGRWHFYRGGCWGCYPLNLAGRSAELDERWGTGRWDTP